MKAIAAIQALPVTHPEALIDITLDKPVPAGRDILVAVQAVGLNPVDYKVRRNLSASPAAPRVLGWDSAGVVEAVGPDVTAFKPGDKVYYAGDITRPGSNAEYQLVDERIVGRMPATLSFEQAAALPLTAITAWEALFERMGVPKSGAAGKTVVIVGGAGGVGSIAIQLAAKLAGLTVVATASRPDSAQWAKELGAHHVINHFEDMPAQLQALSIKAAEYVLILTGTTQHFAAAAAMVAPQGAVAIIDDPAEPLDVNKLKGKSAKLVWEMMFTRSMFQTPDMAEQGKLLTEVAALVDAGTLRTTLNRVITPLNAATLRQAHAALEQGGVVGKIVLKGF
jgi:zinc-binding alcohol dehydrogenase family protein